MAYITSNGARLYYVKEGDAGDPLVFVHGSWTDHRSWDQVAPLLARRFRVIRYDRRGHSQSEAPPGQGSVHEDVADLELLIERVAGPPAHVAANSFGASIALRLAAKRPDIVRTMVVHEPPLLGLLAGDTEGEPLREAAMQGIATVGDLLSRGELQNGARQFVEVALGPGGWDQLPSDVRETLVSNALTFLDELGDPDGLSLDLGALAQVNKTLVSNGDQSPPFFLAIVEKVASALPNAQRITFAGAGHVPHSTHPGEYAEAVLAFAQS
jgi:pimeloyl-ACP methyl ester carboxylesterase